MYKYLSIILGLLILVGGSAFAYQNHQWSKQRKAFNNQLAEVQGTQQETETARSRLAFQVKGLKADNKELQKVIEDRDEEIVAKTKVEVRWKDKYFQIKNSKQSTTDKDGNEVEPGTVDSSEERIKVEFEHLEDPFKIKGFTLTNPAYSELQLEWTRGLTLELILTKDDDDTWRVYLDSENKDIVPVELNLQIDPSVFEDKWYENIGLGLDLGFGKSDGLRIGSSLRIFYKIKITKAVSLNPRIKLTFDVLDQRAWFNYGASLTWNPFRR